MQQKKILLSRIFPKNAAKLLKDAGFELTLWEEVRSMSQQELITLVKGHDALLSSLTDKIDHHFLNECSHLEIISQFAVGYDNIDIPEATRLGIPIGNTPDVLTEATADLAFGLMLATARKMFFQHKSIIQGKWQEFNPIGHLGMELKNKTLGVFGLGRIGTEMAKKCQGAYNMKVIYNNRRPNLQAEKELNAEFVDFKTLLAESDVISIHCSLNKDTKEIFNQAAFSQMKPSSIIINTSRGQVHNEIDLIDALKKGLIWGAGLDVTNPEPMHKDNPLLQMDNVAVLPHIGSATFNARKEMARLAATNIISYYQGKGVMNIVNPETLKNN